MSWDNSWVRGTVFGAGCFLTLASAGLEIFADDSFLGSRDLPGPEGAYLGPAFALGVGCLAVAFKDQIAGCCRSSGGSPPGRKVAPTVGQPATGAAAGRGGSAGGVGLQEVVVQVFSTQKGSGASRPAVPVSSPLKPHGRNYTNSNGSVVASRESIEAAEKLALADKRPGCFTFLIQLIHPKGTKAQVRFKVGRDRKVTSNPVFVGLQAVNHSEAFIAKNGGVRRPILRGSSGRAVQPFSFSPLTTTLPRGLTARPRMTVVPPGAVHAPLSASDRNAPLPPGGWEAYNFGGGPALASMMHKRVCSQVALASSPLQPVRTAMARRPDPTRRHLTFEKS